MTDTCDICGKEFKNLGSHRRYCVLNKLDEPIQERFEPELDQKQPDDSQYIKIVQTDFEDTIEDQCKKFFLDLPAWTHQKPSKKSLAEKLGLKKSKPMTMTCMFLDEDQEPKLCYVPYDMKDQLLKNPETGAIYPFPVKGNLGVYKASNFLPLINCPPVHEEYDIPQHYALFLYNTALAEGQLNGFDELIKTIEGVKIISLVAIIGCIITIIGASIMTKTYAETVQQIAVQFELIKSSYGL